MAFIRPISLIVLLVLAPGLMANTLQDLKFSELPGGRLEMRATFAEPPGTPEAYAIETPARIVMDFSGSDSQVTKKKFSLGFGVAQSAVVLSSDDRTRVIINLTNSAPYDTSVEGNTVVAVIGNSSPGSNPAASTGNNTRSVSSSGSFGARTNGVQDVDFRRDSDGAGKVVLSLSGAANASVRQTAKGIEVNFINTDIPSSLRRRLDVNDFATPVSTIESFKDGKNVRIVIKASGQYDYLAYQSDSQYIVSIKPLSAKEVEAKNKRFAFKGQKISLNFQDIEIRSVLKIIAEFTDLNLVASDSVEGSITLKLDNVPWDQALELVLRTKGLDKRRDGKVLFVAPAAEIAERERQELETRKQLEELAPLRTEYIRIKYANAKELFELFGGEDSEGGIAGGSDSDNDSDSNSKSILSSRGQAIVDERTNSIILTDTATKIEEFKAIIDQIDIPVRQVMIESRIVIANNDFRKELGVRISGDASNSGSGNRLEASGRLEGLTNNDGQGPEGVFLDSDGDGISDDERDLVTSNLVDLGVAGAAGSLALNILTDNILLGLELSALESTGYAEIISQPKVITGDKQQATIESGQEIPFSVTDQDGNTNTTFKDAVLKLDVTPQITPNNRVIMDIQINKDSIGQLTEAGPAINVTELSTRVLVGDGQTIVLGGIFESTNVTGQTKVPLLGDIPGIGRLFRNDIKSEDKQELLIFITPRILDETLID